MISNHPHPQQAMHRWFGRMAVAGMVLAVLSSGLMVVLAFGLGAGLVLLMIPFLLGLVLPLFLLTSLYPAVMVVEEGIQLQPNGFPATRLTWDELDSMTEHTLLRPPPPGKFKRKAQVGEMILIRNGAAPFHYRIVSMIAGYGGQPVFAISNRTHTDYDNLKRTLKQRIRAQRKPSND